MMPSNERSFFEVPLEILDCINPICDQFEADWRANKSPRIEEFLLRVDAVNRTHLFGELIATELEYRERAHQFPQSSEYEARFPDYLDLIKSAFTARGTQRTIEYLPVASTPRIGEYLVLEESVNENGGRVLRARHRHLQRTVLLTLFPTEFSSALKDDARLHRDLEAIVKLDHPHVATVYDADWEGKHYYVATEAVDGRSLAYLVEDSGPISADIAVDYVLQAAEGIAYAHEHGIRHLDLKPADLVLDQRGVVKVTGFELARVWRTSTGDTATNQLSITLQMSSNFDFMAPEHVLCADIDERADIYGLGCILWFLLAGRAPFSEHSHFDKMHAHVSEPIPSLTQVRADISEPLQQAIDKMVAKDRNNRFSTVAELIDALVQVARPLPAIVERQSPQRPHLRRGPKIALVASLVALIAVVGILAGLSSLGTTPTGPGTSLPKVDVDLLSLIDPRRDAVAGTWQMQEGALISPKQFASQLKIPFIPPDAEYQLECDVETREGKNALLLGLTSEGNTFHALFGFEEHINTEQWNFVSGLEDVDDARIGDPKNPTTVEGFPFPVQGRATIVITVRSDFIEAKVDGRVLFRYKGSASQLTLNPYWGNPLQGHKGLWIGAYDCEYRIHRLVYRPLTEQMESKSDD